MPKSYLNKKAKNAQESQAQFFALFNQSADPIMTLEPPSWKFTSCNRSALKLFEVPSEEVFTTLGPWNLSPEFQPDKATSAEKAAKMIQIAMQGGSHYFEWQHKTLGGRSIDCKVLLSRIDVDNKVYLQASVRDISLEKKAINELNRRTDELKSIVLNSPLGIIRFDSNFCYRSVNPAFENLIGYTEFELCGQKIFDGAFNHEMNLKVGESIRVEQFFKHKSGSGVWVFITCKSYIDSEGQLGFLGIVEDITESKQNRLESETVLQTMSEGLVIQDVSGQIEKFNPEALEILGLTADQLLGRTSFDPRWCAIKEDGSIYPGDEHPSMVALRTNAPIRGQVMGLRLPTGQERWIKINAIPFESSGGRKVASTFGDVTEIINATRDINYIFNNSNDLMCIVRFDGRFHRLSPSFEKLLGWTQHEFLQNKFIDYVHLLDVQTAIDHIDKLKKGDVTVNFECRFRNKEGQYRLISWSCTSDSKTGSLYATGRDVTDQRKGEIRNRSILDAIDRAAIVAFTDKKGQITDVNENFCKISGYDRDELIGRDHRLINSGFHPKSFFQDLWKTISSGQIWSGDVQNRTKNGDLYHVRSVIAPLRALNGSIEEFIAIRFDVTGQKRIEKDLLEAQQTAKIGSWRYDLITGEQIWSSEHYRIFEIPEPQSQHDLHKLYRSRIHPDDISNLDRVLKRSLELGEDFVYNHRVYLDGGLRIKHVRGIGKVTKNSNGNAIYISGTCQDITDLVALEEQNRFILEAMGIGIWKFNPNNNDLFWDQSMYSLFEISPDSFSGHYQAWESSLTSAAKERAVEELGLALSGKKDFNTTFEIQTKNGNRKYIGGRGVVTRNEKKQPIMMYGINWDRTPEVTYERDLKKALELNEAVRRSAKFAMITTNLDGVITGFNPEAERILGFCADEVIGKMSPSIFHDQNELTEVANELSRNFNVNIDNGFDTLVFKVKRGEFDERDWNYVRKDGARVPVRLNITGLRNAHGEIYGFLAIARDISERVVLQEQLLQERAKSVHNAKLASLGEMSAGIAHEINNPLAIISGNLSLLNKYKDDPEKMNAKINSIQRACFRIEKIVKGLKKFSRTSSESVYQKEKIKDILDEVLILTEPHVKRYSVLVHVEIDQSLSIDCDVVEIEQVFVNLLNNAVDAIKNNSEKWIKLKAFSDQNNIVMQVIDSGKGVADEVKSKLFHPFFSTKPVGEGTGLGLSIAKGILDQHGASIFINQNFSNTCFEIRFPKSAELKKCG